MRPRGVLIHHGWPGGAVLLAGLATFFTGCGARTELEVRVSVEDASRPDIDGGCFQCIDAARDTASEAGDASEGGAADVLVLFGGSDLSGPNIWLADTWTFDGTRWQTLQPASSPPARYGASMATFGNKLVLFGGNGSLSVALNDTWEFDGTTWTPIATAIAPPGRWGASMAAVGGEIILFGGASTKELDDAWAFDGESWRPLTTTPRPMARQDAVGGALGGDFILFGGWTSVPFGDTWSFDGTSWSPVKTASSPTARGFAAMTLFGSQLFLFGGYTDMQGPPGDLGDTWTFDGLGWSSVPVSSSPPAREGAAMAALGDEVVLFGGAYHDSMELLGDTWVWDGTRWRELSVASSPRARSGASMAFVP